MMTDNTDNKNTSTSAKVTQSDVISAAEKDATTSEGTEQAAPVEKTTTAASRKASARTQTKTKELQPKSSVSKIAVIALILSLIHI